MNDITSGNYFYFGFIVITTKNNLHQKNFNHRVWYHQSIKDFLLLIFPIIYMVKNKRFYNKISNDYFI